MGAGTFILPADVGAGVALDVRGAGGHCVDPASDKGLYHLAGISAFEGGRLSKSDDKLLRLRRRRFKARTLGIGRIFQEIFQHFFVGGGAFCDFFIIFTVALPSENALMVQ